MRRSGVALMFVVWTLTVMSAGPASAQLTPILTTQALSPVTLGTPIYDRATLSVGTLNPPPTGILTFHLYGPNDHNCTGPIIFQSVVPVTGNGTYQSASFTPPTPGSYNWVVRYSGDANYLPVATVCGDPAEISVVTVLPTVDVQKDVDPASRPQPGGDFTYTVTVTNTSNETLTITSLTDTVYGDLGTRPGTTCNTAIGTILAPIAVYSCQFVAPFLGSAGASLTDVVTVTAVNPVGVTVTDNDSATVTITSPYPLAVSTPQPVLYEANQAPMAASDTPSQFPLGTVALVAGAVVLQFGLWIGHRRGRR